MAAARKTRRPAGPAGGAGRDARRVPARAPAPPAAPASPAIRVARVAKGRKPQYFSDPAIDKLLWMTVTMMEELSVARDRLDTVERLLARKRVISRRAIERFHASPAEEAEREARRADYVARVMRVLQAELDELGEAPAGDGSRDAEAVAAVSS